MRPRALLPLAVVALTLAWATSASAFSISFIEPVSETANISATTDLVNATVTTSPELASISAVIPGLPGVSFAPLAFALREGAITGPISDLVTISMTNGSLTASFQSDAETGLSVSGTPVLNAIETTVPQLFTLIVASEVGSATFAITLQSDLDLAPVPEPSTLLLFGSGMAGLGAVWRRSRRN